MSQFFVNSGGGGSGSLQTLTGDDMVVVNPTAGNINVITGLSTNNSGCTFEFTGSGSTLTLNVTDVNQNTVIGMGAGTAAPYNAASNTIFGYLAGAGNTASSLCALFGFQAGIAITSGSDHSCFGASSGASLTDGVGCTCIGNGAGASITGGSYDTCIGTGAGRSLTGGDSSNIILGHPGVGGDNNTIRIGTQGSSTDQQNLCYVAGITGATLSAGSPTPYITYCDATDGQLYSPVPASSHTVIGAFGSVSLGTARQNTSHYPILVNVDIAVTASTAATIIMGVGSTLTPTTDTVIPSFTVAAYTNFSVTAVVPSGFYLLVNTTGTITVGSTTTWSCAVG